MRVYLAGKIDDTKDYKSWRQQAKDIFDHFDIQVNSPVSFRQDFTNNQIMNVALDNVRKSTHMLINTTHDSGENTGTAVELYVAYNEFKKIVAWEKFKSNKRRVFMDAMIPRSKDFLTAVYDIVFEKIMNDGTYISSSGTTGTPKTVFRSSANLEDCATEAMKRQSITSQSKILTVTRMTHAGGLILQTLPAYLAGAEYKVTSFNPYSFLEEFKNYTHTFLTPKHIEALMKTKSFWKYDFQGKFIAMGSDKVPSEHINSCTSRGATVLANWGMSEIGPCVINKLYEPYCFEAEENVLGDYKACEYKIENNLLHVKSDMCVHEGWFNTNDIVEDIDGTLYYRGRNDA